MKKKIPAQLKTIYWQNFMLTASVVMLTLVLLGTSFFALSYGYALDERSEEMQDKATVVSGMVSSYVDGGSLSGMKELASFAASVTDEDFLICNSRGNVLLTTDTALVDRVLTLPDSVTERILTEGAYTERTTLGGIYEEKNFVVGVPVYARGQIVGSVLAVSEAHALTSMWRAFFSMFFMTTVTVLLLAFVVTYYATARMVRPLRQIAPASSFPWQSPEESPGCLPACPPRAPASCRGGRQS